MKLMMEKITYKLKMQEDKGSKRKRLKGTIIAKYYIDYIFHRLNKKYGLTYPDISKIITGYHEMAREDLAKGEPIYFKKQLGNLLVYKERREVKINEKGEVVNNLPINLPETFKLWEMKPELKHKTYVRFLNKHSDGFYFSFSYQMSKANFPNKKIYKFHFNATLKKMLTKNIKNKKVDAYIKSY